MENKEKKGIWKKIAAIFASGLLAFSVGSADTSTQNAPEINPPRAEMNFSDKENYYNLIKHYPDLKETAGEVISLNELLSLPVNGEICDTMVPQGLAIKDGLIIITAYDGIDGYKGDLRLHSYKKEMREKLAEEENHKVHNSVIVVLDQNTKELLTTIELEDQNHVGGIAIDDDNAYIAKSLDGTISVISFDKIKEAARRGKEEGIKSTKLNYDNQLPCLCDSSFVSLRKKDNGKNQLVVGTWNPFPGASSIKLFDFGDNNNLVFDQMVYINSSANGATFVERDGKEYLIVACSLGRALDSNLFVYEVSEDENGKLNLSLKSRSELPPMMEELAEYEGDDGRRKLVFNSEAFSKRYEIGRDSVISNGLIISDLDSVLDKEGKPKRNDKSFHLDIYNYKESEEKEEDIER